MSDEMKSYLFCVALVATMAEFAEITSTLLLIAYSGCDLITGTNLENTIALCLEGQQF